MEASKQKKILITGANGYIGSFIVKILASSYQIISVAGCSANCDEFNSINLLNPLEVNNKLLSITELDYVIHIAAIAHGQKLPAGQSCYDNNVLITKNLLNALSRCNARWIFFSSTEVYGGQNTDKRIDTGTIPNPISDYAKSKLECERILAKEIYDLFIVRLPPVFSNKNLIDISKRVFFPGTKIRMLLGNNPKYSFCSLDTVGEFIQDLISKGFLGTNIVNLKDQIDYEQNDIFLFFRGYHIYIPVFIIKLINIFAIFFLKKNSALQLKIFKLIKSNLY